MFSGLWQQQLHVYRRGITLQSITSYSNLRKLVLISYVFGPILFYSQCDRSASRCETDCNRFSEDPWTRVIFLVFYIYELACRCACATSFINYGHAVAVGTNGQRWKWNICVVGYYSPPHRSEEYETTKYEHNNCARTLWLLLKSCYFKPFALLCRKIISRFNRQSSCINFLVSTIPFFLSAQHPTLLYVKIWFSLLKKLA